MAFDFSLLDGGGDPMSMIILVLSSSSFYRPHGVDPPPK